MAKAETLFQRFTKHTFTWTNMAPFTVDGFAAEAKEIMSNQEDVGDKQKLLKEYMLKMLDKNSIEYVCKTLDDAVPPGAGIGEVIVFADDDLTMLWGQIPPRFQSAIHNHTIFANLAPQHSLLRKRRR